MGDMMMLLERLAILQGFLEGIIERWDGDYTDEQIAEYIDKMREYQMENPIEIPRL